MKTTKEQRKQENIILAKNALESYLKKENCYPMDGVSFPYDSKLARNHALYVNNKIHGNQTVIRLKEIIKGK